MKDYFMMSKRLGFSIWEADDLEYAKKLWLNPNVTKYISATGKFSLDVIEKRLTTEVVNQEKYQVQYWPIFLLETNELVGCCGIRPYDLDKNIYEFGVHIIDDFWHQGLATEAGTKVIDYAFNQLKVNDLFAGHNPLNSASKKMLEKLGFKYSHDEFYEPTGLNHPSYFYK